MWSVWFAASLHCAVPAPTFTYANFDSTGGLVLLRAAERSGNKLRLTPAVEQDVGAAWFAEKQAVANGFETSFAFQLTQQGGLGRGADGFAFVLQNIGPAAIAGRGSAGGFALGDGRGYRKSPGIPSSIAVFFDTYQNRDAGDPSGNYIAICTNGRLRDMRWPPPRLAYTRKLKVKLKDGRVHAVRVTYQPPVLSVYLDNPAAPVLTSTLDLTMVTGPAGMAYVGFTASTGAGYENHDILNWSFTAGPKAAVASDLSVVSSTISFLNAACLPDRNLCTPDHPAVEETSPGRFHIVLPANLEWGVSIPNGAGRSVTVSNVRGMICWDFKGSGAEGCSATAVPVSKTEGGRTYFSIADRRGAFQDNEGFLEFDAEVR